MSHKHSVLSLGLLVLAAGCNNSGVTLSVRAGPPVTPGTAAQPLVAADGVDVTRVQMVVRDIKFQKEGTDEQTEVSVGPFLLDLDASELEGGVSQIFDVTVPAGRYDEVGFVIHRLEDSDRNKEEFAALAGKDASIVITGTIDGEAFEFVSTLDEEQEIASSIDIADGPNNVTLNIDPTTWFRDAAGNRLDPRVEANFGEIEENLKRSIDAFEDDDHDGDDDDRDPTDRNGVDFGR